MLEPMVPNTWQRGSGLPSRLFGDAGVGGDDYELYEEADAFRLAVDLPGLEPEEIAVAWDEGLLSVSAEHVEADRDRTRRYFRRFRFPKTVDDDAITAEYDNGVLEVHLPIAADTGLPGEPIPIED